MTDQEGVIKYSLEHAYSDWEDTIDISQINAWRNILFQLKLIGQRPERYQGLGYGNISQRLYPGATRFLITGTQTGHLEHLSPKHFTVVDAASPENNTIRSHGPCKPSSEALTHASVYLKASEAQAVIHVHSPEIWRHTATLNLPHTAASIAYGSVEMAAAVESLFDTGQLNKVPLFSMLGHEDGIVAFGNTIRDAAMVLLSELANALAIE